MQESYLRKGDEKYELDACYMKISLGEPYGRAEYKLIAAIIRPAGSLA